MPSINPFAKRKSSVQPQQSQQRHTSPSPSPLGRNNPPIPVFFDDGTPPPPPLHRHSSSFTSTSAFASPEKKAKAKSKDKADKDKDKLPTSPRSKSVSSAFHKRSGSNRKNSIDSHPLNLPPEELRRLSQLSASAYNFAAMASPRENGVTADSDPMETTPAPKSPVPAPSESNGEAENPAGEEERPPQPPQHRSPPPPDTNSDSKKRDEAEGFKQSGNKFYKNKQYRQAIQEYGKAIEADPSSSTYVSNRAAAYMADNSWAEALEDCKLADDLEPGNSKILHRLAKVYTALGRPREALDVYDRMQPAASAKDKSPALQMQNYINQAQESLRGDSSGSMARIALDQAEKGLGFTVQPPRRWRLMRGEAYLKMGNVNSLGDAQNIAMSLLRANNQDPEALVLRGRALYAQGENDKAVQHLRQALACDPDFKDAVKYLRMVQKLDRMKEEGNTHFKSGRYQKAVDVYTEALSVDPLNKGTNSKILNNRAMCYSRLKDWPTAIKDCDQAIKLDSSYTKAKKTRAKALGEGGDWEEAVKAYKDIAEQNPEEPGIQKEVRNAELELKKSKRKDYYKILEVEKDAADSEIKRAYKKLAIKHHPDKNHNDPEAEDRFKDISEAYETLIDPQKRQHYDSGVDLMDPSDAFGGGGGFHGGMGGGMGGVQIDPEMLFNMMGGGGGRGGFPGGGGGGFSFASGGPGMGGGQSSRGFPGGFPFG